MGSNLHPSLAENLHPSLAEDLAGAAQGVPAALGARYWFDPSVNITLDGSDNVSAWIDRIGGLTLEQTTAINRPGYLASDPALGGNPGLQFTATAAHALAGTAPSDIVTPNYHNWAEYTADSVAVTQGTLVCASSGSTFVSLGASMSAPPNVNDRYYNSAVTTVSSLIAGVNATHTWSSSYDDASVMGVFNAIGNSNTGARFTGVCVPDQLSIGSRRGAALYFMNGSIGHVVWFDRTLTAEEITIMTAFMDGLLA